MRRGLVRIERAGTLLVEPDARVTIAIAAATDDFAAGNYELMSFAPGAAVRGLRAENFSVTGLPAGFSGELKFSETTLQLNVKKQ
jgi:hypothetical protein